LDWFEVERPTLVAAVGRAARRGRADLTAALALRLAGFLRVRGYRDDHICTLREALAAVRVSGHERLRVRIAQALFSAYLDNDLDAEMGNLTEEMLASAHALGESELLIRALIQASLYAKRRGRLGEAADYAEQALAACGDSSALLLATALSSVATIYIEAGRPHEALPLSERAVAVQRAADAPVMTAMRLLTHADVLADLGRLTDAEAALAEALALTRAAGHQAAQAYAELRLGDLAVRRGQWRIAGALIRRACATFERLGDAGSVAYALRWLGDLAVAQGRPLDALEPFRRALETWQQLRLPLEAARQHARLSRVLYALGDVRAAAHHAACADILDALGLDEKALKLAPDRVEAGAAR
jgi:tetratricopeptide (TPR) repeat protein